MWSYSAEFEPEDTMASIFFDIDETIDAQNAKSLKTMMRKVGNSTPNEAATDPVKYPRPGMNTVEYPAGGVNTIVYPKRGHEYVANALKRVRNPAEYPQRVQNPRKCPRKGTKPTPNPSKGRELPFTEYST